MYPISVKRDVIVSVFYGYDGYLSFLLVPFNTI